ncbi:MAG: proline dehydrogenase family protein [Candidatus Woesearchaeota archaeon]|jgi:proline dehydrogenase
MNLLTEDQQKKIKKGIFNLLDNYRLTRIPTNWLIKVLGEPYLAGHSLEEGLGTVSKEYTDHTRYSTLDILGESAKSLEDAQRYRTAYNTLLNTIPKGTLTDVATISVKPSAICFCTETERAVTFDDATPFEGTLEAIVKSAKEKGIGVTLDMEDNRYTDASLQVAQSLWSKGYDNLGIVLQSRLNRTLPDIRRILNPFESYPIPTDKIRVRACIGIYDEPANIATKDKRIAKKRLIANIQNLFTFGAYVEIATHDHEVIHEVVKYIQEQHISSDRFEFQFLKGVQNAYDIETELQNQGYKVRYYMPFEIKEGDGIPYMKRRLIANPDMVISGAKNMWQQAINYIRHLNKH